MKNNTKKNLSQGTNNCYHIITYGCQMNVSDSEKIANLLEKKGYRKAKDAKSANLVVINICSVRQSAMDRAYSKIRDFTKLKIKPRTRTSTVRGKRIILAGCLLEADKRKLLDKVDEIWPPDKYFGGTACYENKTMAYVPIMTGCNNFCSYCVVPYTRGREKSRSAAEIINEVKRLIKSDYKEIVLIGQNVNSYIDKLDLDKTSLRGVTLSVTTKQSLRLPRLAVGEARNDHRVVTFPTLLKIINDISGNFRISFLTSHPRDMSDELIEVVAKCNKVKKEIHLPVQSGDDEILQKMNRGYTVKKYKNLIKKIRQKIPGVKISTDVIVGFPGETKKHFENTVKLFRQIKFAKAYIAKYSPRLGTAAAKLKDDVLPQEKKRCWQILEKIANQKNKSRHVNYFT